MLVRPGAVMRGWGMRNALLRCDSAPEILRLEGDRPETPLQEPVSFLPVRLFKCKVLLVGETYHVCSLSPAQVLLLLWFLQYPRARYTFTGTHIRVLQSTSGRQSASVLWWFLNSIVFE